jgi:DNA-binding response OmpR family regulator
MSVVLVVEDDQAILRGLSLGLRLERYDVLTASNGEAGYQLAREKNPDLVLLDLMLPKMGGFELCRRLRADGFSAPILMLTARAEEADRVLGLDLGADDYITKPFSINELMARIRAHLRRAYPQEELPRELRFADVVVDFRRYEASKRGKAVELTRKEFGVLRVLAARVGEVVQRNDLLNQVWGYESFTGTRTVDNHIASLRAKLEANPADPKHLLTVHGVGYKLTIS